MILSHGQLITDSCQGKKGPFSQYHLGGTPEVMTGREKGLSFFGGIIMAEFGDPRLPDGFWNKINVNPSTGCWEWKAGLLHGGYSQFWHDGKTQSGHRVAYRMLVGEIKAETLDHLCRNRICVNPEHLEPVTRKENILRGFGVSVRNSNKTYCPKGHSYSGENLYIRPEGYRVCKTCQREAVRKFRMLRRKP